MTILKLLDVVICLLLIAVLLGILFISIVYFVLYLMDIIFWICKGLYSRWLYRLFSKRSNSEDRKIKDNKIQSIIKRISVLGGPHDIYARYETPLFSICCAPFALELFQSFYGSFSLIKYVIISHIFICVYIVGMNSRCTSCDAFVQKIEDNLDFFRLSFGSMGFLMTVICGGLTYMGTMWGKEKSLEFLQTCIENMVPLVNFISKICNSGLMSQLFFGSMFVIVVIVCVRLFIFSIPLQILTYFYLLVVKYFGKHRKPYKKVIDCFAKIVKILIKF